MFATALTLFNQNVIFPLARLGLKLPAIRLGIRQIKSRSFVSVERLSLEQVNRIKQGDHRLVKKLIRDDAFAKVNYSRSKHKGNGMKKKWRRVQTLSSDSENEPTDNDEISTKTSTDVHENNGDEIRDRTISTCTVLPKRQHIRQNNTSSIRSGNKLNRHLDITNNSRNKNDSDLLLPKTNQSKLFQNVVPPDKSSYDRPKAKVTTDKNDPDHFPKRLNKYVHPTSCSDPVLNSSNDNSREHCIQTHSANHADNSIKSHHPLQSSLKTSDQNSFNSQFKISLPNAKLDINVLDTPTKYKQKKNDYTLMKKVPDTDKTKHTKELTQVGKHTKSVDHKTDDLFLSHHKNSTSVEPRNDSKSQDLSKNSDPTIKTQDGDKGHKHLNSGESYYSKKEEKSKTVDGNAKKHINKKNEPGHCVNQKKNVSKQKLFDPIVDTELFTPDIIMTSSGVKKTADRFRNKEHDQSDCKKETEKTGNKDKNDTTKFHESCKQRDGEKTEQNENRGECDKKNSKRRQSHNSSDDHNEKSNKCYRERSVDSKKDNTDCSDKKENRDKYLKNDSKSERMASGNKSNQTDRDANKDRTDGKRNENLTESKNNSSSDLCKSSKEKKDINSNESIEKLHSNKRRKSSECENRFHKKIKSDKICDTEPNNSEIDVAKLDSLKSNQMKIATESKKRDYNKNEVRNKGKDVIKSIKNESKSGSPTTDNYDRKHNLKEDVLNKSEVKNIEEKQVTKKERKVSTKDQDLNLNKPEVKSIEEKLTTKKKRKVSTEDQEHNSNKSEVKNIEETHATKKERNVSTEDQVLNLNKPEVKSIEEKHTTKKQRKVSTENQEDNLNKSEVKNIEETHATKKERKVSTEDQDLNLNKSEVKSIEEKHLIKKQRKLSTEDHEHNLNKSEVKSIEEKHTTKKQRKVSTEDQEHNLNKSEVKNIEEKHMTKKERKVSTEDQEHTDLGDSSSTKLCKSSDSRTEVAVNNSQDYHSSKKCRKSVDSNRNNYSICDKNRTPQNLYTSETSKLTCSINISSIKDLPVSKINLSGTQRNTLLSFEGTDKEIRTNLENNETKDLPFINNEEEISCKKRKMSNGENSSIQNNNNGFKLQTESNLQQNKLGFINPVLEKKMENLEILASNILTIIPTCDISTEGQYNKQIETTSKLKNTENTLQTTIGESETSKLHLLNNDVDKGSFANDESGVTGLENSLQHENVFNSTICDRPDNSTLSILIKDSAAGVTEEEKVFNKENIISTHDFKSAKSIQRDQNLQPIREANKPIQGDENLQPIREANVEVESDLSPQETSDGTVLNAEQINSVIEETPKPSDNLKNDCRPSSNMNCSLENCDNIIHSEEKSSFATEEQSSGCKLSDTIIEESTSDNVSSKINTSQENLLDKQTYSSDLVNKITCGINPTNELISSQAEEINVNNVIQVDDAVKYEKTIQSNDQTKNVLMQDAKFKWMRSCDEYVSEKDKVNINHGTSLVHNPISEPNSDKTERSDLQARPELRVYNVTFNSNSDTLPIIKSIQSRQVSMNPKSDNFKTSPSTGTLITNEVTPQNESPGFFPSKDNEHSITVQTETLNTVTVPDKILIPEKLDEVVDKQNVSVQINTQIANNTSDNVEKDHHESLQNTCQNKHFNSTKNALLGQTNVSNQPKISPSCNKKRSTISTTSFRKILPANVGFQNGVRSISTPSSANVGFQNGVRSIGTPNSPNVGFQNGVRSITTSNFRKILPANVGFQNGVRSNRFYPNKFNKPNIIPNQNQSLMNVVLTAEQRRLIKFKSAHEKSVENVTKSVNVSSSTTNELKKEQPVVGRINKTSKIDRINQKNLTLFGQDCDEPEYETLNNSSPDTKTSPTLLQKTQQPRNENIFKDSCNEDSSSSIDTNDGDSDFGQKEKKTNINDSEKIKIVKPCHRKLIKPASTKPPSLLKKTKKGTSNGTKIKQINQEHHSVTAKCNESPSQVLPSMPTIDDSVSIQDFLNTLDGVNNSVQEGHDTQKACTLYPAPPSSSSKSTEPAVLPLSCTIKVNNSKVVPKLAEEQTLQQLLSSAPKNFTIVLEKNTTVGENNNICDSFPPKVQPKDFNTCIPNIDSKKGSTREQISVHDEFNVKQRDLFSDQNKTTVYASSEIQLNDLATVVEGKYPEGNNSSKLQSNTSPTIQQNSKERESNMDELRQIKLFLANGESISQREKEPIEVNKFNCQTKHDNKRTSVLGKENSFNGYLFNSSNVCPGQVNNCNSEESKIGKIRVKSGKELGIATWGNFTPIETNCLETWRNVLKSSGEMIKPISSSLTTQETVTTQGESNKIVHKDVFSTFFESESVSVTESVPVSESVNNTVSSEPVPETELTHETEPIPAVESTPVIEPTSDTESAHETESIKEELSNEDLHDDAETLPAHNVTAINTNNSSLMELNSSVTPGASVASDISTAEVSLKDEDEENYLSETIQTSNNTEPQTLERVNNNGLLNQVSEEGHVLVTQTAGVISNVTRCTEPSTSDIGISSGQGLNVVHLSSQNKEPIVPPTVEQDGAALPPVQLTNSQLNSNRQNTETNQSELLSKNIAKMLSKPDRYWTTNKIQCAVVYKDVFDGLDQTIYKLAEILHLVITYKEAMEPQIARCRKLKSDSLIQSETERIEKAYQENIKMRGTTFCFLFHSISKNIFSKTKDQTLIDFLFIFYIKLIENLLKIDTNHEVYVFSGRAIIYEMICTAGIKNDILNNVFNSGDDVFKTRYNQVKESLKTVYERKFSEQEVLLLKRATDQNHTPTRTTNINHQQSSEIQSNLLQVIPFPEIKDDDDVFENPSSQEQVNFETENTFTANESVSNNGAIDNNYFGENDMIDYSSLQVSNLNRRDSMSTIDQLSRLATSLSSQSKSDNYTNRSGPCLMSPPQSNQIIPNTYIASNSDQMICNSERNHASSDDVYDRQMASRRHSEPTYTPLPLGFNPPPLLRGRSVVENVSKPMNNTAQTIQSRASTSRPTYQQNNINSNHSSSINLNSQIPRSTPIQSVPSQNVGLRPFVQPILQSRLLNQSHHSNRDSTPILPPNRHPVNNHHYLHPGSVQTSQNKQFAQNQHPSNSASGFVTNRNIHPNLNPNSLLERTQQNVQLQQQLTLQRQQQSYMSSLMATQQQAANHARQRYNPTSNYTNTLQSNATPNMHMMGPQQVYSAAQVPQNNHAVFQPSNFQHNLQVSYPQPNMVQPRTAAATSSPNLPICYYPPCNNQSSRPCPTCHNAFYCSTECQPQQRLPRLDGNAMPSVDKNNHHL